MGFLAVWAGLLLFLILGKDGNRFLSFSLLLSGLLVIGIYYRLMKTTGTRVYRRLKDYHEPFDISVNDESIHLSVHENTYDMPWTELKKALIATDMILLYPSEKMFYIFPKENFSEGDYAVFETMVRQKIAAIH